MKHEGWKINRIELTGGHKWRLLDEGFGPPLHTSVTVMETADFKEMTAHFAKFYKENATKEATGRGDRRDTMNERPGMELGLGTLAVAYAIGLGLGWLIYLAIRWVVT